MSRSGYSDSCEGWELVRWRGAVASAIRGKRGQAFLKEMLGALDAMPNKRLIEKDLLNESGEVCAMGSVGVARGMDMSVIEPHDREGVATAFGIPKALACEIAYENDEVDWRVTPEERWTRMHAWIAKQIKQPR